MRFPSNLSMEILLCCALAVTVVIVVFALQDPPGDRTRFTLERSDATRVVGERRTPLAAEETALGR